MVLKDPQLEPPHIEREHEIMREGARSALRCAMANLPIGAILLAALVYFLAPAITSGQELLNHGEHWDDSLMPATLFLLLGGCFGCFLGWRIAGASGLTGPVAWGIGMVALLIFAASGLIVATIVFHAGIPLLMYVTLAAMTLIAAIGLSVFTLWGAG